MSPTRGRAATASALAARERVLPSCARHCQLLTGSSGSSPRGACFHTLPHSRQHQTRVPLTLSSSTTFSLPQPGHCIVGSIISHLHLLDGWPPCCGSPAAARTVHPE